MVFLRLFLPHLQRKTNRTFMKLVGILPGSGHDSILSEVGVSTEIRGGSPSHLPPITLLADFRTPRLWLLPMHSSQHVLANLVVELL